MIRIGINDISKTYHEKVLHDLNLDIRPGEIFGILGPSGCGKTTLLHIIAGLLNPDKGIVLFNGKNIKDDSPKERGIGMLFQTKPLFPWQKVFDNIAFVLKNMGCAKKIIAQRVCEIAHTLKVENLLNRYPRQLSGGEQQRVALAGVLVAKPKVILLDEPLSNLDAQLRHEIRGELRALLKDTQATVLYVTHDQEEALHVCDRIAIMNNGAIEQVGTYTELWNKPVSQFVWNFLYISPEQTPCVKSEMPIQKYITTKVSEKKKGGEGEKKLAKEVNPVAWIIKREPRTWITSGVSLVLIGIFLAFWSFNARETEIVRFLFSSPYLVLSKIYDFIVTGSILAHFLSSAKLVFGSMVLGLLIGPPLGILLSVRPVLGRIVAPFLTFSFVFPTIAMLYIFLVLFGFNETTMFWFLVFGATQYHVVLVFQKCQSILSGKDHTDVMQDFIKRAVVDHASRWRLFCSVLIPVSLPQIFVGLRLISARTWNILILVEASNAIVGQGYLLNKAYLSFDVPGVFAHTLILALYAYFTWTLIRLVEQRMLHWNQHSPI